MSKGKRVYGLIGFPLEHSFSRGYFMEKFKREGLLDCEHRNFEIEHVELLRKLVAEIPELRGVCVTIPYKESVLSFLDNISPEAKAIGAVNCIKIDKERRLTGYNTDVTGFRSSLLSLIGNQRPNSLILGTGGAAKGVKYVLTELGMDAKYVSRTASKGELTYADLDAELISAHRLIVNASPLGTFPNVELSPDIPYQHLSGDHFLFDLVYNPPLTRFMEQGAAQGARSCNGYDMLIGQAEAAWEIWNSEE